MQLMTLMKMMQVDDNTTAQLHIRSWPLGKSVRKGLKDFGVLFIVVGS